MKKIIAAAVCIALYLTLGCFVCFAEEAQENGALDELSESVNEGINAAIDDDTRETMLENGIEGSDVSQLTIFGIINAVKNAFADSLYAPIKTLGRLAAVLILSALARSMASGGGVSQTFMTVSVLGCITIIYQTVYAAFQSVCAFLERLSEFMLAYIPIYASVTAASGNFTSGGSYYASMLCICEIIGFAAKSVIMPFLSVFLALSFTAAANPDMRFSSAAESVKNAVQFTLTALMTVFTGLISVQSFSGAAADGAAARAVKFGASNFIPIIGGSVSEAYSTVYAGIGIIRSSVGTIGMIAVAAMLLHPLVTLLCVKLTLGAAKLISDLLGLGETSELLRSTGYAMSAAISTMLCFAMMFIISTAVLMLTAANTAV